VKQQFTGSYTLDVASRTIVLSGIEIPQARLAVVINSTVGFVYHNIEHEPTATVTVSDGNTTIFFPHYKDCSTHRNSDALSIFYDDGVDLGKLIKDESDETQTILSEIRSEFETANATLSAFKVGVQAEADETQGLLSGIRDGLGGVNAALPLFNAESKAESDELQAFLDGNLPTLAGGLVPLEFLNEFSADNDVDVGFVLGGYGPSRIIFSRDGVFLKALRLYYGESGDSLGRLIRITSGWTPAEINGLRVWLDASDLSTLVFNGATVSQLGDKSVGNHATQPTASFQPGYQVNGIGGRGALLFSVARQRLQFQTPLLIEENMIVASVWRRGSSGINTIDLGRDAVNGQPFGIWWGTTNFINSSLGVAAELQIFSNSMSLGDYISFARRDSAVATISLNGVEVGSKIAPSPISQLDFVGYRPGANQTHNGLWGETIVAADNSLDTKQKIEGYLSHKWKIPLPPSHPYHLAPP
jgi:hypothetical protein